MCNISIIIPTYNRCKILEATLNSLLVSNNYDIIWEVIVIDNNSNDHTKEIVAAFQNRLPIKYLFEKKQGKNVAVNKGISEASYGILVFIDDDISVDKNWFNVVQESVAKYPDVNIFGGKVLTKWPEATPEWVYYSSSNFPFLFRNHDLGDEVINYSYAPLPTGANFWIRKSLLKKHGAIFNEQFGPTGNKRVSGSETEFLVRMHRKQEKMLYIPNAIVHHRVLAIEFSIRKLLHRFRATGKSALVSSAEDVSTHFLGKIPLYLVRQLIEELFRSIGFAIFFKKSKYMNSMIKLAYFFGKSQAFWERNK